MNAAPEHSSLALQGVNVLDLTRFPPGAYCTVMLADLGAEVVRIDSPGVDPAMFGNSVGIARGKRSVALDLRHPGAPDLVRRLIGWADVVVDNARPGQLDERGYGPARARQDHPTLIWCSITGFGQDGPYAHSPGHDLTYFGHSGLLDALNGDLPWHPQVVLPIPVGALMAVIGITTALLDRERTGNGAHLDISLSESASWLLSGGEGQLSEHPRGIPVSPARTMYECGDGTWVTVAADEPRAWSALCTGLGLDDLAASGRPGPATADNVRKQIAAVFATRPAAEWVAALGPAGSTIGIVNTGGSLVDDPHVVDRGSVVLVDGQSVPANPIRMSGPDGPRSTTTTIAPPAVGADTDAILAATGCSDHEIAELHASGVLGER